MEKVLNYIVNHGSIDSPVTNTEICKSLKISEQTVRGHINTARSKGYPICSCREGYYYSEDKSEIIKTIQSLMHRTIAVERAVNGLLTVVRNGMESEQ